MLKSKANWDFDEQTSKMTSHISIMDQLFHSRGLYTKEEQQQFLHPKLTDLASPEHFHHMKEAKSRIFKAINSEEKIMVYGDYDADGVTSTALLVRALTELGADCAYYIPNRFTEGYGLHTDALEKFQREGYSLVITVDNGIANCVEADVAKRLEIDLIITDHHEIQEEIPDAYAVIHPALSPDYPFKQLAGVGVAFQLAHYLLDEFPVHLLEFAAIGTIADLVPLLGENRVLVAYGLKKLSQSTIVGIQALKRLCNLDDEITARDVGFLIAPRLNAVGRLQNASLAVELLLTEDHIFAEEIAEEINELNIERQQIVKKIVEEAEPQVSKEDGFIVLYDKDWHEGVLGIAASRLVKKFDRPVMMLTYKEETDELKGSARSIPLFNLFKHGMKIRHLFTQFGGHSQAAGMTFPYENLEKIKEELNKIIFSELKEEDFKQVISISASLPIEEMTENLIQEINKLAPFGMNNEEPIFHFQGKPTQLRQIGQDKSHLKIQFNENNHRIEAIGFGLGDLYAFLSPQSTIEVVGKLQVNEWNGNRTVQVLISDIAVNDWQLLDFRGRKSASNMNPYLDSFTNNVIVTNDKDKINRYEIDLATTKVITYEEDISSLEMVDIVFVYDLPDELSALEDIIRKTRPHFIHVSYTIMHNAYLEPIPPRDDFKWLYAYLYKNSPVHLNVDLKTMMQMKRWSKDKIIFILKVFLDLKFITIQENTIYVNLKTEKKQLQTSKTFQHRVELGKIEKTLYYSTYEELKQWFELQLRTDGSNKEEIVHEL